VKRLYVLVAVAFAVAPLVAQQGARNGEWRWYAADTGSTRYSPLDQINASNFKNLEVAWRLKTDMFGPRPEFQLEGTPLMVNGILYATAGTRRAAIAVNAATGELLWVHGEIEGARGAAAPRQFSGRGLAYWSDGANDSRILYVTPGYRLIALDAKTGYLVKSFGENGVVDLKKDDDQDIDLINGEVGLHATPMVAKDVVIVGAAHASGGVPKSRGNVKGYVRGFDVRTGKRLWIFHTIPLPGEFGNNTWEGDSWSYTGNTGVWAQISVDEDLGIAYIPVEMPTGDYYGGHRPGSGLFGESLVAVDLRTGRRKWHYQLVHHGIWDHDIPCAPILADITVNGRTVKAVAQPTKQSFLYVFDRVTGEPVWPIEERPVAKGEVPGEWYAPTQPFPTKPPAYDRQGVSTDDLIDFTPELKAEAVKFVAKYKLGPLFTPPVASRLDQLGTLMLPSNIGGTNWQGGAYDPETHIVYIPSQTNIVSIGLLPPPDPKMSDMNYVQGNATVGVRAAAGSGAGAGADSPVRPASATAPAGSEGGAGGRGAAGGSAQGPSTSSGQAGRGGGEGGGAPLQVQGLPLVKPPYGRITAIDLDQGTIKWQIAHGETPDNIRNHPALKGINIPRTGQLGHAGLVVTKTLVIAGETRVTTTSTGARGAMLRAYDKATGQDVGAVYLPAQQSGSPMTYMVNGRQYIVVAVSGGNYTGEYIAFRLPEERK